jgi:hypothetical protein
LEQQRLLPRRVSHVAPRTQRARAARGALQRPVAAAAVRGAIVRQQRRALLLLLLRRARRRSGAARARQLRHARMRRWQASRKRAELQARGGEIFQVALRPSLLLHFFAPHLCVCLEMEAAAVEPPDAGGAGAEDAAEEEECRICRGEGTEETPLLRPCKCAGSMRWVHSACLMQWLQLSKSRRCEVRAPAHTHSTHATRVNPRAQRVAASRGSACVRCAR